MTHSYEQDDRSRDDKSSAGIDLTIRLGVVALILYFTFVLIRPFIGIFIWSVVVTIALYPAYARLVHWLGGRRRLAAVVLTLLTLATVVGPVSWFALIVIDGITSLSAHFSSATLALPTPPTAVKDWPLIGRPIYELWDLATTNFRAAAEKIAPHLKPVGRVLVQLAAGAGTGTLKFFIAILIAGFLYASAPRIAEAVRMFARRLSPSRGEEFTDLAEATIRAVSRGVVGVSVLQAGLAGLGMIVAGVPATSLLTAAVLILGIIQIGPSVVILPLIVWGWAAFDTLPAVLFTIYMLPVNLLDNALRPLFLRGLRTPLPVVLMGAIGGTISYGISGLFLGPIVLAVLWDLVVVWTGEPKRSEH